MMRWVDNGKCWWMGAIAILCVLCEGGCSIKAPQAPSWDTTMRIPLVNRTFSSGELFDKLASDNFKKDSSGNSFFYVEKTLEAVTIESVLMIDSILSAFTKTVDRIKVATPAPQMEQIVFADYLPLTAGYVPDTGMWVTKSILPINTFSDAEIAEGGAIIRIDNNTGFPIDSLNGELRNRADGTLVAIFTAPHGLADGAFFSDTLPLAGKTVRSDLDLLAYFHTTGGLALPLADRTIDYHIAFTDTLYASSVTGKLDQFSNDYQQRAKLADDIHVTTASLASGSLAFAATNHLPVNASLNVHFPEITRNGTTLSLSLSAAAGAVVNQTLNLSGWQIEPTHDSLLAQITATILSTGDQFVTINSSDNFGLEYRLENLRLASATAVVAPTQIEWNSQNISIDVPRGFENASLDVVELNLTILNRSELSGNLVIDLRASNGKTLSVSGNIAAGSAAIPSTNQIHSSALASLISPIPDSITITGVATVGDGITSVHLASSDYLSGQAVLTAPMSFKLAETRVEGDKNHLDVSPDVAERADRLQLGFFQSTISNHLPLGAQVTVYISTDSATLFTHPLTVIGPIGFSQARVNGDGIVVEDTVTVSSVNLSAADLRAFQNRSLYVAPVVSLSGTQGQTVRINAADHLDIQGIVEISARVGGKGF